jgi:hypothetical protein
VWRYWWNALTTQRPTAQTTKLSTAFRSPTVTLLDAIFSRSTYIAAIELRSNILVQQDCRLSQGREKTQLLRIGQCIILE